MSAAFTDALAQLGLATHRVPLFELFGKAGGGPACATLYLPRSLARALAAAPDLPLRYRATRAQVHARRERIPETLRVDREFFAGKRRG